MAVSKIKELHLIVIAEIKDENSIFYILRQKTDKDINIKNPPDNLYLFGNFIVNRKVYYYAKKRRWEYDK